MPKRALPSEPSERGRDLRQIITAAAVALVNEQGLTAVAMSHVAERAGITRATLYKYFPDVRAILSAWQEQRVAANLAELAAARDGAESPEERLSRMLEAYAVMVYQQHSAELIGFLNATEHGRKGYGELGKMLRDLLAKGAGGGVFRRDVPPNELAAFCISALSAAGGLSSVAAARRLARLAVTAVKA